MKHQQQQFCNLYGVIPIKKRRFPFLQPTLNENHSSSANNDPSKENKEPDIPVEVTPDVTCEDSEKEYNKEITFSSAKENSSGTVHELIVKEHTVNTFVESVQSNADISGSIPEEASIGISVAIVDEFRNEQDICLSETSAELEVQGWGVDARTMTVKQEIIREKTEGNCELKSTGPVNDELLGARQLFLPLEGKNDEVIYSVLGESALSFLSLSAREGKQYFLDSSNSLISNFNGQVSANRCNWDLNTTVDEWEGAISNNDEIADQIPGTGRFSKTSKGKQVLNEHSSNSSETSVQPSFPCKSDDNLGLSLAMFCTGGVASSLSDNIGSHNVNPNLKLGWEQPSVVDVKAEPVDENYKPHCTAGNASNMALPYVCSVKRRCIANNSSETVFSPSIGTLKSADQKSIKSEVQEGNLETFKYSDATVFQSGRKIIQLDDSSASSSILSTPFTFKKFYPSIFSTSPDLPMRGDMSNQSELSSPCIELLNHRDISGQHAVALKSVGQDNKQLLLCKAENVNVHDVGYCKPTRTDDHSHESCGNDGVAGVDKGKNMSSEMLGVASFGSEHESYSDHTSASMRDVQEKLYDKELSYDKFQELVKHSVDKDAIDGEKKMENVALVDCGQLSVQPCDFSDDPNNNLFELDRNNIEMETNLETSCTQSKEQVISWNEPENEEASLGIPLSEHGTEVATDIKDINVTPGRINVNTSYEKELSMENNGNKTSRISPECDTVDKVIEEIYPINHHGSSLPNVERPANGTHLVQDSNRTVNKSRIINLAHASSVSSHKKIGCVTSRIGKEEGSNFYGELHPRGNRVEQYVDSPNKHVKDRVRELTVRNSGYRFGPLNKFQDDNDDYESETYNGQADYRVASHRHHSSIIAGDEPNDYGTKPYGISYGSSRRSAMNNELTGLRPPQFRRGSSGGKEGQLPRGIQMHSRFPRNISPSRCATDDGSNIVRLRRSDRLMQHPSDDIMDPAFSHLQHMHDEVDDQLMRKRCNFSDVNRKGYPRFRSKSPGRSPGGQWPSFQHGFRGLPRNRSPVQCRIGRMRSPDRTIYHDEMVSRRQASPLYMNQHFNALTDLDTGEEHDQPRSMNSNWRTPRERMFQRRVDMLDTPLERGEGDHSNGPLRSTKFQEPRSDEVMNERRKFNQRRSDEAMYERGKFNRRHGPARPLRTVDTEKYHVYHHEDRGHYRFYQDAGSEFDDRSHLQEHVKHPPGASRQTRIMDEQQQDGNHKLHGRFWNDDGLCEVSGVKRRRF